MGLMERRSPDGSVESLGSERGIITKAEWGGYTVEVLYRVYAHCIDDDDGRWNERMERALG